MTQPMKEPRKFSFDAVFDGPGASGHTPYKRLYTTDEVERLTAQAKAEGEKVALARAEAQSAAALSALAESARAALPALAAAAHEHRVGAAELAVAAARKIADAALEHFPEAPLQAALTALASEVEATPKLVLRAPQALIERLSAALAHTAESIGFPGQIVAREDASLPPAAFRLEWGDGAAAFDPAAAAVRVAEALEGALAADGLHAELIEIREDEHG